MSYDYRCYDLASTFLEDVENIDYEKACHELAQLIQTTIEDWIEYAEMRGLRRNTFPDHPKPATLKETETKQQENLK